MTFQTTRWTLIHRAAGADDDQAARLALDELCALYWPAVYAFFRYEVADTERAADLTQGLFAHLLERGAFAKLDPERGRFRGFLKTVARNFAIRAHEHDQARKRGGGVRIESMDVEREEGRWLREPVDRLDAEALFDRRWAQAVIEHAIDSLRRDEQDAGRGDLFERLRPMALEAQPAPETWAELAEQLGATEAGLKASAQRLRRSVRRCSTRTTTA